MGENPKGMIHELVFGCPSCGVVLRVSRGPWFDANTCPSCRAHIRVQVSAKRKNGVAVFVDRLKFKPYSIVLHQAWTSEVD